MTELIDFITEAELGLDLLSLAATLFVVSYLGFRLMLNKQRKNINKNEGK